MEGRKFGNQYFLRLDPGEEIIGSLKKFCREQGIKSGVVSGIGAVNRAEIGLFDPVTKEYHPRTLEGNFEVCPLSGNITGKDGGIYLHLHVNLGDAGQHSYAGHLTSAVVSATCEIFILQSDGKIERKFSDEIGLNLLKFQGGQN